MAPICAPMLQELNYYITKCYCTCSFVLGRKMFWARKECILQRKAFNIQHSIGDNESETAKYRVKLIYTLRWAHWNQGRIYFIPQVVIKHCSQGPMFSCVPTNHYCVVTCDLKLYIPGPMTQNIFIFISTSSNQSTFCCLVAVPSPQSRILTHSTSWHTNVSPVFKDQECSIRRMVYVKSYTTVITREGMAPIYIILHLRKIPWNEKNCHFTIRILHYRKLLVNRKWTGKKSFFGMTGISE